MLFDLLLFHDRIGIHLICKQTRELQESYTNKHTGHTTTLRSERVAEKIKLWE